jgi:UDP-GlcNAc:undecaprenyl-phosphate/decaprenyl-phosphate GlcNAc-1-phosphate transferase
MIFAFLIFILFLVELLYFKIANRFNIIDKPNERSAHSEITIRGGGIIFWVAAIIYFCYSSFNNPYFFIGLTLVTIISFIDDIYTLSNRYRLPFQFLAIGLALFQANYFIEPYFIFVCLLIVGVGILNAYNFMDGINGITGGYSLVIICTFLYINNFVNSFTENNFLYSIIASLLVFNYFNFRTKAKCFAGDVGSVSMAVIIIFLLLKLIALQNQYYYILILAVYGVDSVLTIIQRILKRENIFKAHNSHFFQVLARNKKTSHVEVSGVYMAIQLGINLILISIGSLDFLMKWLISITILAILAVSYLYLKPKYLKLA